VAIKTIAKDLFDVQLNPQEVATRFQREAQAAGSLNHPGIVRIYEYGETDEYAFIAMECVEGTSLREYFAQECQFPENDVVSIMAQLLDALAFAHDHAVVHRDVKPANIIIMKNGRIKLADFGIARLEASDRTQTGLIMGTPGYIAPEYYLSAPIDHRVDIFASGVVLYELLTGQSPFRGSPEAVMRGVCHEDPAPPSMVGVRPPLPEYDSIVAHALRKDPGERFSSAGEFRRALLAEYRNSPPELVTTTIKVNDKDREAAFALPPTPPPTGWDAAVLASVAAELTQILGPVAKVMVRRAAREHQDLHSLVNALAAEIAGSGDAEAFVQKLVGPHLALPPQTTESVQAALNGNSEPGRGFAATDRPVSLNNHPATQQDVDELVRALSIHIGPVARIMVKRVQAEGLSRADLFMKVARTIDSESVRAEFMREFGSDSIANGARRT
jgi:serine/threonine-protein kinase